jgi:hypothetical protein
MPCSPLAAGSVRGCWRAARRPKYRRMTQAPQAARCHWVLGPLQPCMGVRLPAKPVTGSATAIGSMAARPHRPIAPAGALRQSTPHEVEALVVALKPDKPHRGARKIRACLLGRLPGDVHVPAKSTIHAVVDRHGLVEPRTSLSLLAPQNAERQCVVGREMIPCRGKMIEQHVADIRFGGDLAQRFSGGSRFAGNGHGACVGEESHAHHPTWIVIGDPKSTGGTHRLAGFNQLLEVGAFGVAPCAAMSTPETSA